mgnify:CR=1 FL=1
MNSLSHTSNSILPLSSRDVFDMESICLLESSVNCNFHTHRYVTLDVSPTPSSLRISATAFIYFSLENVHLLYNKCQDSFPVIFDTGASLAISFDKNDFVGNIRPLTNHRLEGLANELTIEGVGIVKWKSCTKTFAIVVTFSCYYVP